MKARIFILTAMAAIVMGAISVSAEENEPTVTEVTTTVTETTVTVVETPKYILGDVNSDSKVNVRDCAFIVRKLAEDKADELSPETVDYNKDTFVNVRDAASIARDLNLNFTSKQNKPDYDVSTIEGIKAYVNDTVIRKAIEKYGITDIKADDNVESNTWYSPTILLTDVNYYSTVTSVNEYGFEGIMPESYVLSADDAIADLMKAFDFISQRFDQDGSWVDMSQRRIRIKWLPIDNGGNFEIYVCYGGDY